MNKKLYYIIPLFLLEAMIQLGFFWLSPAIECRWVVYAFLTVTSITHFVITFVFMAGYGVRRSMPTVIAGSVVELMIIVASALLLAFNASVRSALFLMFILTILYTALVATLALSIDHVRGENGENGSVGDDMRNRNDCAPNTRSRRSSDRQDRSRSVNNYGTARSVNRGYVQNTGRSAVRNVPVYNSTGRSGLKTPPPVPTRP